MITQERKQLSDQQMIYTMPELKSMGYSYYLINKMVDEGKLLKLNNKSYENKGYKGDESDYFYVKAYTSEGVICLLSAHDFTS